MPSVCPKPPYPKTPVGSELVRNPRTKTLALSRDDLDVIVCHRGPCSMNSAFQHHWQSPGTVTNTSVG
ncbi:hypothetical protein SKAU_G00308060 [Synaphobranchus kaupii]|uniref:Uncharacterized protein n=1 Tax=Synaphobranchus kaupii TaxID=118154 RepID=A0A9Q1ER69_SYNKA|nr:hypothetical protein SKAU_G00308060 [Synaphobranchus kaupii]